MYILLSLLINCQWKSTHSFPWPGPCLCCFRLVCFNMHTRVWHESSITRGKGTFLYLTRVCLKSLTYRVLNSSWTCTIETSRILLNKNVFSDAIQTLQTYRLLCPSTRLSDDLLVGAFVLICLRTFCVKDFSTLYLFWLQSQLWNLAGKPDVYYLLLQTYEIKQN